MRRRFLPLLLVLSVGSVATTACSDDSDPADREVTIGAVFEGRATGATTLFPEAAYVRAWDQVAGVLDRDPGAPASFLEDGIPDRLVPALIVACAWGAGLQGADGPEAASFPGLADVEGIDALGATIVEATNGGDCGSLDADDMTRLQSSLFVPPDDLAEWLLLADYESLRAAIATELAPELAEADDE